VQKLLTPVSIRSVIINRHIYMEL